MRTGRNEPFTRLKPKTRPNRNDWSIFPLPARGKLSPVPAARFLWKNACSGSRDGLGHEGYWYGAQLVRLLHGHHADWQDEAEEAMEIPRDGTTAATPTGRVLVIEDHPATAALLEEILNEVGYEVTATDSGLGAVGLARQVQPCAIILDLGLPYRSGAVLLEDLKADPDTARIPIIVVSALTEVLSASRATLAAAVF